MAKGTINKVILIGRLGADPELKYTPSGAAVATFNLATNEAWKDKDGNWQEKTEWHRIVLWTVLAKRASEHLKKGQRVYIEGSLKTKSWEDKDGIKRYVTEIHGQSMQFLEAKNTENKHEENADPVDEQADEEDLPF